MDRFQVDHWSVDVSLPSVTRRVIEAKSVPVPIRRRLRPRFGYLIAISLICAGTLLVPLQVMLAAMVIATVCSLATVGLAFVVQMPVPFLQSKPVATGRESVRNKA